MVKTKYYAVLRGRRTGIFLSWRECEKQIKGFSGAVYKSFETRSQAELALKTGSFGQTNSGSSSSKTSTSLLNQSTSKSTGKPIIESICVDAACSGNPGAVEYQGVCTATGDVLFHKQPIPYGTNNLGEFLAIVHGLAYLKERNQTIPIYTDSETAMLWVRNKKVRTTLQQKAGGEEIFILVERALTWLKNNEYSNPILKWNTKVWGEIPADFGRK